jgi:hypothetical protein
MKQVIAKEFRRWRITASIYKKWSLRGSLQADAAIFNILNKYLNPAALRANIMFLAGQIIGLI